MGLSLVFASSSPSGFSAPNADCSNNVKTHIQKIPLLKEATRSLKETAETHLSRKKRKKKCPEEGEPPPHSRKRAPSLWGCGAEEGHSPQPARKQARGHRCGGAGCRLYTGPLSRHGCTAVNEKQMAQTPCARCAFPLHTPLMQGLLGAPGKAICFSFYRQRKAAEEGGQEAIVFKVSGELM